MIVGVISRLPGDRQVRTPADQTVATSGKIGSAHFLALFKGNHLDFDALAFKKVSRQSFGRCACGSTQRSPVECRWLVAAELLWHHYVGCAYKVGSGKLQAQFRVSAHRPARRLDDDVNVT